jgi:hypothetical protein
LSGHLPEAYDNVLRYSGRRQSIYGGPTLLGGLGNLVYNLALSLTIPSVLGFLFFPRGWLPRTGDGVPKPPATGVRHDSQVLLGRTLLSTLGLLILLVVVVGLRGFRAHWFAPFLLLLPVWFFGRLRGAWLPRWRYAGYGGVLGFAAVGVVVARLVALWFDYDDGKWHTRDFLHAEVAARVEAAGKRPTLIVASEAMCGAYQQLYFSEARIECLLYPTTRPRTVSLADRVLVVWDTNYGAAPAPELKDYLVRTFGPAAAVMPSTPVHVPDRRFRKGIKGLRFLVLDEATTSPQNASARRRLD